MIIMLRSGNIAAGKPSLLVEQQQTKKPITCFFTQISTQCDQSDNKKKHLILWLKKAKDPKQK